MKKTWCIGVMNSLFIARMERILALYRTEYAVRFPLICYDERPCFLIGDKVSGLEIKAGQPRREHYAYENGLEVRFALIKTVPNFALLKFLIT